jgi:hypothetical protein
MGRGDEMDTTTTTTEGGWDPELLAEFLKDLAKGANAKRVMDAAKARWDITKIELERERRRREDPDAAKRKAEMEAMFEEVKAYGVEPEGEIDGADLADQLVEFYRRFVNMTEHQAHVLALWTLHTHAIDAAQFTPYIAVEAPTMRSGKTRTMEVAELVVHKPEMIIEPTEAVVFRVVEAEQPTLLLDEYDAIFANSEQERLRALLNAGYQRGATVPRIEEVKGERVIRKFSVFSAKMLAGIGRLPSTIADRSIPIRLQRKKRGEHQPERFRRRRAEREGNRLRSEGHWWARRNLEALRDAEPDLPDELNDRQQDGAEAPLAIADRLGGEWPGRARRALVEILAGADEAPEFEGFNGGQLLGDVRRVFDALDAEQLRSAELVKLLNEGPVALEPDAPDDARGALEDLNWSEYRHGRGLNARVLANRLRDFKVGPRDIRFDDGTRKGYRREDLEDAWERYL